jgi:hypothetical protein
MQPETFWTLLHDSAHWEFELFVGLVEMLVFDVLVGLVLWPFLQKHWIHHIDRDKREELTMKKVSGSVTLVSHKRDEYTVMEGVSTIGTIQTVRENEYPTYVPIIKVNENQSFGSEHVTLAGAVHELVKMMEVSCE